MTDPEHLSPEIIAAYLAQEVSPDERRTVLQHLLTCRECRRDIDEARELGSEYPPRQRWAAVAIPAAAAAALLLFLLPGQPDIPARSAIRGTGSEGVQQIAAVAPANEASMATDSVLFVWRSEGAGSHYVLTVTDEHGDVVWTAPTSDTTLTPPRGVDLAPGQRYYWYVDALLEGARSSTTGVREFTVRR